MYSLGWHALVKNQGRFPEEDRAQFETSQDRLLLHYDEVTIREAKTLRASLSRWPRQPSTSEAAPS